MCIRDRSLNFHQLAKSEIDPSDPIHSHIRSLWVNSFDEGEDDVILDVSITAEEVEGVLSSLKKRKSPGPDNICSEHLIYGGLVLK